MLKKTLLHQLESRGHHCSGGGGVVGGGGGVDGERGCSCVCVCAFEYM